VAPLAVQLLNDELQLLPPPPPAPSCTATSPVAWVSARVPVTWPPAPPFEDEVFDPPPPPPPPLRETVAETVPAGGVAVTNPVVLGVELHDAATEVVVAAAIWGVAVIAAATAMTLSMPATTEVAMPVAVNRKSRP
jgi:hypothetical protein